MDEELLARLNKFTRREHTKDEVYIFDVILCDNEVDRDNEKFSIAALNKLKELFTGKTGIFDHDAKGSAQTARIFETETVTKENTFTSLKEPYTCLKAHAYMVRTASNEDLIKEIDGGIKKEVSISCSAGKRICSVCGSDTSKKPCRHIKGNIYDGKKCFVILDDITDAYEWSFVAVPAQINAGITKAFGKEADSYNKDFNETVLKLCDETKADIVRLCFLSGSSFPQKALGTLLDKMDLNGLYELKKSLSQTVPSELKPQLSRGCEQDNSSFKL